MSIKSRAINFLEGIKNYPHYERVERFKVANEKYQLEQLKEEDIFTYWKIVDYLSRNEDESVQFILNIKNRLLHFYPDLVEISLTLREEILDEIQLRKDKIINFDLTEKRIANPHQYIHQGKNKLDFMEARDAIYAAYGINWDDIFSGIEHQKRAEMLGKEFGFTQEEIHKAYSIRPIEENKIAWLLCYWGSYLDEIMPYVNYWHHIIKNDFKNISDGSTQYFEKTSRYKENIYFQKLREIYWLEFGEMEKNGKIPFWVSW